MKKGFDFSKNGILTLSVFLILLGVTLLIYMITVEDELGVVPALFILFGIILLRKVRKK